MITAGGYLILITQIIVLLTALFAAWRATRSEDVSKKNAAVLQRLEINVDGRLTELLELTKTSSRAEGLLAGAAGQTQEATKVEVVKAIPIEIKKV